MKNITNLFIVIGVLLLLTKCSPNEDTTDNVTLPTENAFSVIIDGVAYEFDTFSAYKSNDNYEVRGSINNEESLYIRFNANGVLDRASFSTFGIISHVSFYHFPKATFSISDIAIDRTNNVIQANFGGLIYGDNDDLSSNTLSLTQGFFNLVFYDSMPNHDEFIDASINGETFESMKHFTSSNGEGIFKIGGISDNEYIITINFDNEIFIGNTFQGGTYTFDSSNEINSVGIEFKDPYNDIYEAYSFSGTLVIDDPESPGPSTVYGSFSGIATNTNGDSFVVSDGSYSLTFI
jgi:hypothetical protein